MKKILIIEDDTDLLENTSDFLKEEGYETITASNGAVGVQKALLHIPDLIICDITMPKLDGYQVFKTLQEITSTATIPFIFLTAKVDKEDIRLGMQMGADDYITKPFDFNQLHQAIKTRLEKQDKLLFQNDEKFFTLIDSSFSPSFMYQEQGFVHVNQSLCKRLEYTKDEILNLQITQIVSEEHIILVHEKFQKCLKGIQPSMQFQLNLLTKNKNRHAVDFFGNIVKIRGKVNILGSFNYHIMAGSNVNNTANNIEVIMSLSKREYEVLQLICEGYSNNEIAEKLYISNRTVDKHRANLIAKTNSRNTAELVMYAVKNKLIEF